MALDIMEIGMEMETEMKMGVEVEVGGGQKGLMKK